ALLEALERGRLGKPGEVLRLHEVLCFLRAYPDDAPLLELVERLLARFDRRSDLRRHRRALADTGIAGTAIHYRFFQPTASWLARRWGDALTIDWKRFETADRLEPLLGLLALPAEAPGLDEIAFGVRGWIRRLKGPGETDAAFLVRRFDALPLDPFTREALYDALDPPLRLAPRPDTPARGREKHAGAPVFFQGRPLSRSRPSLAAEARRPPLSIWPLNPREGQGLIDLARGAMVTRERDLDVFCHADRRDVRLVDCGGGLRFACFGAVPERRLLLEAVYGFLTLKNGVPIGYVLASALFGSSEVAYNVFETYRGGEAALVYGRVLGMLRSLFGSDSFTIDPYQLGHDNQEALASGAWWFYRKLGFRPRDPAVVRVMEEESRRMKADPGHRSGIATLRRLAAANVFLSVGRERADVLGLLPLANVGLQVTRCLAERFGSRRAEAERACAREAARRLGVRSLEGFSPGERLAWKRWGPLVMILPGLEGWSAEEKRALVDVVRAKGGRRESDFVGRFDRHRRLRRALRELAERLAP
ncbi:MAG TPA: hypothetical protein VLI67_10815, partial [Vicinamibacteria bacterium]|nr:hypothetical protein [Vicinamibacteria bacterium]